MVLGLILLCFLTGRMWGGYFGGEPAATRSGSGCLTVITLLWLCTVSASLIGGGIALVFGLLGFIVGYSFGREERRR